MRCLRTVCQACGKDLEKEQIWEDVLAVAEDILNEEDWGKVDFVWR